MFSVALANTFSGISVLWFKDGAALSDTATFSGANTDTLTITGAANEDEGNYYMAAARSICLINSDLAMLTVRKLFF